MRLCSTLQGMCLHVDASKHFMQPQVKMIVMQRLIKVHCNCVLIDLHGFILITTWEEFMDSLVGITTPGGWKGPSRYVLSCRIYGHGLDTHHLAVVVVLKLSFPRFPTTLVVIRGFKNWYAMIMVWYWYSDRLSDFPWFESVLTCFDHFSTTSVFQVGLEIAFHFRQIERTVHSP